MWWYSFPMGEDMAMQTIEDLDDWHEELSHLWRRIGRWCYRVEPRERMWRYLVGLLSTSARKNSWHLAETMHEAYPEGMQRLLNIARWDVDAVRDELRSYVLESLAAPDGILVVDETGFLKQGNQSAGVARQYSGTAGRIENQQIGVFLTYASVHGAAFIDRELYLPEVWTNDPARCTEAGIPTPVAFTTKPELAQRMVARALAAKVPMQWFVGDAVYSADALRLWLQAQGLWYVVAIASTTGIWVQGNQREVASVMEHPSRTWIRLSAGMGSQGERWYDWAWLRLPIASQPGMAHWILARRSHTAPDQLAYFHAYAPEQIALTTLVQVTGTRWVIEVGFAQAKEELGLDHYEVRQWRAWYRHVTLVLLMYAYLIRLQQMVPHDEPMLVAVTVPEVRCIAQALAASEEERYQALCWSRWRRRHQAVARQAHIRRRQALAPLSVPDPLPTAPLLPGIRTLTEELWQQMGDVLPKRETTTGRPAVEARRIVDAMLWVMHHGISWRALPPRFGPWQTIYARFRQWKATGIWEQMMALLVIDAS